MDTQTMNFFQKLLDQPGPSGYEHDVSLLWKEYVTPYSDHLEHDFHGNTYAILNVGKHFQIMIASHADEIGLVVNYVSDDGFIYFMRIGGVDPAILLSQRVKIQTKNGEVPGVINKRTIQLRDAEKKDEVPQIHELWIDIGAKGKEEVLKKIRIGDPIIWGESYSELSNNFVVARNFDNRIGCLIVAETMRRLSERKLELKVTVCAALTVQEEIGLLGAWNLANRIKPQLGIAVDVTHDTNTPKVSKAKFGDIKCGKGPSIYRGSRTNAKVFDLLESTAVEKGIPIQIKIETGQTGTDADMISHGGYGVPINVISIPCRYMHTSTEIIHLDDVENAIKLLVEFILKLDHKTELLINS